MYESDPFLWLNQRLSSAWIDPLATALSVLAEGWVTVLVALVALSIAERRDRRRLLAVFVPFTASIAVSGLVVQVLKWITETPRPLAFYEDRIHAGQVAIHVLGEPLYSGSFPSGHAATAFGAAAFITGVYGARWSWLFGLAILAGLSRVAVGAHFAVDVLAGAAIGTVTSLAVLLLTQGRVRTWTTKSAG